MKISGISNWIDRQKGDLGEYMCFEVRWTKRRVAMLGVASDTVREGKVDLKTFNVSKKTLSSSFEGVSLQVHFLMIS